MKVSVASVLLMVVLASGLVACTPQPSTEVSPSPAPPVSTVPAAVEKASLTGAKVADSFGNVDFYTTADGDTLAGVADAFELSTAKLAQFNGLPVGAALVPGTKLRLIPAPGPATGARGEVTEDAHGIPVSYRIVEDDTLAGITYRFGITAKQLAEANKVPYVHEQGNTYFIRTGHLIQLQKNPVDSRSGTGATVNNSFGQPILYTTVDGDSFDSLGYKFRSTTEQLLMYNPALSAGKPIPAGTRMRLMPGEMPIDGARGTFTADADGIPLTYTTAAGDTEGQVSFRFSVVDIRSANRPLTGGAGSWYDLTDAPSGELVPGQTISIALNKPINK
ncbi:LysM peptidoglycan-binding domain-containing protein [Arthrobacter sp. ISL-95]|uniref:lytic transglycosylase n=1 Tax=Arthrobacter sp. ISL-95 TaxID=2819116 RepID=UPI001BE94644|nr:LysM peptidoglycan-binding domain-containing protein [Arthrobacter sp. ISL-95]MBT2585163.1 LysM peptidoglycan-binding domain-containing protein [Arthrobacter sp. ISL-95]